MHIQSTKEAEVREQRAEARLGNTHTAAVASLKENIALTENKLAAIQDRFKELEEAVNEDRDADNPDAIEAKKVALANKAKMKILRRRFDDLNVQWETYKEAKDEQDRLRDEQIARLIAGQELLRAGQTQTKRIKTDLDNLQWQVAETGIVTSKKDDKGKNKRKRNDKGKGKPAEIPPTANEAAADAQAVM